MKKILSLTAIILLATAGAYSQSPAPGIFNYQGVARNSVGNVLINKAITLRLTVHDGAAAGPVVYQESRGVTTNPFGLFNVQVGSAGASNVTGTIAGVNWGVGAKYIQVEIDPNGGSTFINIGTAQIASVPYSLYSSLSNDLVLPFLKTQADAGTLFRINNSGTGISGAIMGTTLSNAANAWGVHGQVNNTSAGGFSSGILGTNLSTTGSGIGVTGSQNGSGWGVYGTAPSGIGVNGASTSGTGVNGSSTSGYGVYGTSNTNNAGRFENLNAANSTSPLVARTLSTNAPALTVIGPDIWGSSIGINNSVSGMEWRMNVQGTTWQVTKVPGSTFTPFRLFQNGNVDFPNTAGTSRVTILDNGNVGINTAAPATRLHVVGSVRIVDGTEGLNKIFTSDAAGTGSWQVPAAVGIVTGSGTVNYVPKWTPVGTNLGNSQIFDNGINVGIANSSPTQLLHLSAGGNPVLKIEGAVNSAVQGAHLRMTETFGSDYGFDIFADGGNDNLIFRGMEANAITADNILVVKRFPLANAGVGVGTVPSSSKLEVLTTGTNSAGLFTINNGASTVGALTGVNTATNVGSWGMNAISVSGTGFPGEATHAALVAAATTGVGTVTSSPNNYGLHAGSITNHAIFGQNYGGGGNAGVFGVSLVGSGFGVAGNVPAGTGAGGYFTGGTTALRTLGGLQLTGINEGVNRILTTVPGTGQATWEDAATVGIVSGSGTLNFLPKWTPNGTTLGNSMFFDDASNANLGGGSTGNRPSSLTIWQTPGTSDASLVFRTASGEFGGMFTGSDGKLHLTTNSASPSLATIGLTVDDDNAGGVGIGTVNPITKLNVVQADATAILSEVTYTGGAGTFSRRAANITSGVNSNMGLLSFNNTSSSVIPGWKAGVVAVDSSNDIFASGIAGLYKGNTAATGVYGASAQNRPFESIATTSALGYVGGQFRGGDVGVVASLIGTGTSTNKYGIWASAPGGGTNWAGFFNGQVAIVDGSEGAGKVFTSDASGNGSWQDPTATRIAFAVRGLTSAASIPFFTFTPITQWAVVDYEEGTIGNYNPITGTYTVPKTGKYHIDAQLVYNQPAANGNGYASVCIFVNGTNINNSINNMTTTNLASGVQIAADLVLSAGDLVSIQTFHNTSGSVTLNNGNNAYNFWSIHLIK